MANFTHMLDSLQYMIEAKKYMGDKKNMRKFWEGEWDSAEIPNRQRKYNMSENIKSEMYELMRRYRSLERELVEVNYIEPPRVIFPKIEMRYYDTAKETKPVEEPKNYAVKLLVDQLKQQQSQLTTKKSHIDIQRQTIKNANDLIKEYNKQKIETESKIKELSVALKKLGHKE